MQRAMDINSDVGESFGNYSFGADAEIIPHLSSVNVACGFHAGDPVHMERTVTLAKENDVAVGVHWGLPDVNGFGRREMKISTDEARCLTLYQIGALRQIAVIGGGHHRPSRPPRGALPDAGAGREDRRRDGRCDQQRGRTLGALLADPAGAAPLLRDRRARGHPHHPRNLHRPGLPRRRLADRGAGEAGQRPRLTSPTGCSASSRRASCARSTTPTSSSRRRRSCSTATAPTRPTWSARCEQRSSACRSPSGPPAR